MRINFEEFEQIVREYYDLELENTKYIGSIPFDIYQFVYDNTYTNNISKQKDSLLEFLFGSVLYEDFIWFLYDRPKNRLDDGSSNVVVDGRGYFIYDIQSYLNYVKIEYFNYGMENKVNKD